MLLCLLHTCDFIDILDIKSIGSLLFLKDTEYITFYERTHAQEWPANMKTFSMVSVLLFALIFLVILVAFVRLFLEREIKVLVGSKEYLGC